jgi:hypothetical protein
VRARTWMVISLLVGLSAAGCAPTLHGTDDKGGTILQNQLELEFITGQSNVVAMAGQYCDQYHRSAHFVHEDTSTYWFNTFHFDCIDE